MSENKSTRKIQVPGIGPSLNLAGPGADRGSCSLPEAGQPPAVPGYKAISCQLLLLSHWTDRKKMRHELLYVNSAVKPSRQASVQSESQKLSREFFLTGERCYFVLLSNH